MSEQDENQRSFYAPAVILAIGAAADFFDHHMPDDRTLLEWVINACRRSERVTRTIVVTHDRPVVKAAEALGADGIIVGHDDDPLEGTTEPPAFVTSIAYPFLRSEDFTNAAKEVEADGLLRYSTLRLARRHPVGSFRSKEGRMDFSQTLDREDWRELDRQQCVVPHPHLLTLIAARTESESREERFVIVDDITAFRIEDAATFELAQRMVDEKHFELDVKEERQWRSL